MFDVRKLAASAAIVVVGIGSASNVLATNPPKMTSQLVATGIDFPTFMIADPTAPNRIFILEKNSGYIHTMNLPETDWKNHNFLNLFPFMSTLSEQGLLSMAFHPNYAQNGYVYVCFSDVFGNVALWRYTRSTSNPELADSNSGVLILREPKPFLQHNSGMIQFGPDGYLYMSIGDGGGAYDPFDYASHLDTLKGKIIRIDVDGGTPYAIPPTNPFINTPGAKPEIFAYGLRNPWRFSIDSQTGDLYIGDVGQENREEIDFIKGGTSGQNFGWHCLEGDLPTNQLGCIGNPNVTAPIHVYPHGGFGTAVIGGFVYRGCAMPWLQGTYFFADYNKARIWSFRYDGTTMTEFTERTAELAPPGRDIKKITSFGVDTHGEMYFFDSVDGELFRIVPDSPVGPDANGNQIPDGCEITQGAVPDVDQNGIIDYCVPGLSASQLYLGKTASFDFQGAAPGETVYYLVSLGGPKALGYCLAQTNCISLAYPFFLLTALPADGNGKTSLPIFIPPDLGISTFAMQCVVYRAQTPDQSLLSNVLFPPALQPPPGP